MPTEKELAAERKKRFVAAFESLGRGETPDGKPLRAMDMIAAADELWEANRAYRERINQGPPPDAAWRRYR